jgi:hypothetical protein
MELSQVLKRVRQFVEIAEAPIAEGNTPEQVAAILIEQASARAMADKLMEEYAIQQAELDAHRPAAARSKPGKINVDLVGDYDILYAIQLLARAVAKSCRCQMRDYAGQHDGIFFARVYGYESDLRYFEMKYTILRLHMVGALKPSIDPNRSLEDNCYDLHNAGLNWLEIAALYGWRKATYREADDPQPIMYVKGDERKSNWTVGSHYKRAYLRAIKARGETKLTIAASATETFRRSAADGYTRRIIQRIRDDAESSTGNSSALVLRSESLDAFFREDNPDLFVKREPYAAPEPCPKCAKNKSGSCRDHPLGRTYRAPAFSGAGYARGVRHANTAILDPQAESTRRQEIS